MKPILSIFLVGSALFFSCSRTEPQNTATADVKQMSQDFISAWNSRDASRLDTLFADDVHFLQGEAHYNGRSEVSQKWVRETLGTIEDLKIFSVSSNTGQDLAYDGGTYRVDVIPENRELPRGEGEGNYVLIWKKNDKGAWKLSYAQLEGLPVKVKR